MPSVHFTVKWPNGELAEYYSPSTIIYDFIEKGQSYPTDVFLKQVENGLYKASERVRARYGFACSTAMDNLSMIKRKIQLLELKQQDWIEVVEIFND